MSVAQAIIASTGAAPAIPSCTWYGIWYEPINEGQQQTIRLNFLNWNNTPVYWEVYGGTSSGADFDTTSGTINAGYGSSTQDFFFTPLADTTTEGPETYYVKVGTSSGASDIANMGPYTIADTSQGNTPLPGGDGAPSTASYNGTPYTLTPSTNGTGTPGTANAGDVITWTITSNSGTSGRTMYWWVDNDAVPANTWVENSNNGTVTLDSNGTGAFTRTVVSNVPSHALFRMYVGMSLYQGFLTHGFIGV